MGSVQQWPRHSVVKCQFIGRPGTKFGLISSNENNKVWVLATDAQLAEEPAFYMAEQNTLRFTTWGNQRALTPLEHELYKLLLYHDGKPRKHYHGIFPAVCPATGRYCWSVYNRKANWGLFESSAAAARAADLFYTSTHKSLNFTDSEWGKVRALLKIDEARVFAPAFNSVTAPAGLAPHQLLPPGGNTTAPHTNPTSTLGVSLESGSVPFPVAAAGHSSSSISGGPQLWANCQAAFANSSCSDSLQQQQWTASVRHVPSLPQHACDANLSLPQRHPYELPLPQCAQNVCQDKTQRLPPWRTASSQQLAHSQQQQLPVSPAQQQHQHESSQSQHGQHSQQHPFISAHPWHLHYAEHNQQPQCSPLSSQQHPYSSLQQQHAQLQFAGHSNLHTYSWHSASAGNQAALRTIENAVAPVQPHAAAAIAAGLVPQTAICKTVSCGMEHGCKFKVDCQAPETGDEVSHLQLVIDCRVGNGSNGVVYRAVVEQHVYASDLIGAAAGALPKLLTPGTVVAVKVNKLMIETPVVKLLEKLQASPEWAHACLCEAFYEHEVMSGVDDPHVVKSFAVGLGSTVDHPSSSVLIPAMVQEYAECGSVLRELYPNGLEKGSLGLLPARAHKIMLDVGHGLKACHDLGIGVRDVKAANIVLQSTAAIPGGTIAQLCDFGSATDMLVDGAVASTCDNGTRIYQSPERSVLRSTDGSNRTTHGPKADVYSYGMLLLVLRLGENLPFMDDPDIHTLQAESLNIANAKAERRRAAVVQKYWGKLTWSERMFVMACLQSEDADRPSVAQLFEEEYLKHGPHTPYDVWHS